jgi:hypothetical protein
VQRWCSCFLALDQSVAFFPAKGAHLLVLMERRGMPGADGSKHRLLLADCVTPINPRRETCWSPFSRRDDGSRPCVERSSLSILLVLF